MGFTMEFVGSSAIPFPRRTKVAALLKTWRGAPSRCRDKFSRQQHKTTLQGRKRAEDVLYITRSLSVPWSFRDTTDSLCSCVGQSLNGYIIGALQEKRARRVVRNAGSVCRNAEMRRDVKRKTEPVKGKWETGKLTREMQNRETCLYLNL